MAKKKSTPRSGKKKEMLWWEGMNILNEYLPDEFPHFKGTEDPKLVQMRTELEFIVSLDDEGIVWSEASEQSKVRAAIRFNILSKFADSYSGNKTDYTEYANLQFRFVIDKFVRTYKKKVRRNEMRLMLNAIFVKPSTYNSLISRNRKDFFKDDIEIFASNFIRFAKSIKRTLLTFDEVVPGVGIDKDKLIEMVGNEYLDKQGINIHTERREITYRRPQS